MSGNMSAWQVLCAALTVSWPVFNASGFAGVNEATGALGGFMAADGRQIATSVETLYHVMLHSGADIDARESEDVVI